MAFTSANKGTVLRAVEDEALHGSTQITAPCSIPQMQHMRRSSAGCLPGAPHGTPKGSARRTRPSHAGPHRTPLLNPHLWQTSSHRPCTPHLPKKVDCPHPDQRTCHCGGRQQVPCDTPHSAWETQTSHTLYATCPDCTATVLARATA